MERNLGRRLVAFFFLFSSFTSLFAQKEIKGFEAPESVLKTGNRIFVSNIGGQQPNPGAKDKNGFISELSADGKVLKKKFQKGVLNGPKGLAVMNHTIYVSDIDRVVGFDMNSGDQVFELSIPEATFLNDLCIAGDRMLAVTESTAGKVYLINVPGKSYRFAGSIPGANGVTYDKKSKQLFACGMGAQNNGTGKLYVKDLNKQDTLFSELQNSPAGIFDGIELMDKDHLIVSDWISFNGDRGRLVVYDLRNHSNTLFPIESGPADIYFDQSSRRVFIPFLPKNKVVIQNLSSLKKEE
jgi:hypothetical protein